MYDGRADLVFGRVGAGRNDQFAFLAGDDGEPGRIGFGFDPVAVRKFDCQFTPAGGQVTGEFHEFGRHRLGRLRDVLGERAVRARHGNPAGAGAVHDPAIGTDHKYGIVIARRSVPVAEGLHDGEPVSVRGEGPVVILVGLDAKEGVPAVVRNLQVGKTGEVEGLGGRLFAGGQGSQESIFILSYVLECTKK